MIARLRGLNCSILLKICCQHERRAQRTMTPNLKEICDGLEIRVVPNSKHRSRGPGETCAERSMEKILRNDGPEHLTIVLRSIVETKNNGRQLVAPMMLAISDIVRAYPNWTTTTAWLDALDNIDLADVWSTARANRRAAKPRDAISTMLFLRLAGVFQGTL